MRTAYGRVDLPFASDADREQWRSHLDIDPETALRGTNAKFERRFRAVEGRTKDAGFNDLASAGLDRLEAAWIAVKAEEKRGS